MDRGITFKGAPLRLEGRVIKEGGKAPDFKALSLDLKEVALKDFQGKVKVITSFPSIDTPVCDLQVKRFNKEASGLSSDVSVIAISMDLPFAQKRFCELNEINKLTVLSDHRDASFGINYGLLIRELRLLARSILIVDKNDILRYAQLVPELTTPPDYGAALARLKEIISSPAFSSEEQLPSGCQACESGAPSLPKEKISALMAKALGWELIEDKKIVREFKFKDFVDAKYFFDLVSALAEGQGHHPSLTLIYNKLKITLTTHSSGGLTENDFIMARLINELGG